MGKGIIFSQIPSCLFFIILFSRKYSFFPIKGKKYFFRQQSVFIIHIWKLFSFSQKAKVFFLPLFACCLLNSRKYSYFLRKENNFFSNPYSLFLLFTSGKYFLFSDRLRNISGSIQFVFYGSYL